MTRAALYLRVSLDVTGERLAVTRQRDAGLKIAADRGWEVVREYEDNSISASDSTKVRPAYDQMVRDYRAGLFDGLICWDLDRLTRQPRQLEDWIDAAEGRGLAIVTANGEADLTTDGGRMYARIKAAVARAEVERKSARQTAGQRQRAALGKPPKGTRQTGYTIEGEIIEDEAHLITSLFERFAAGETLYGLSHWLNAEGPPTRRGGKWLPSTVRGMLTNARYAGRSVYKGKVVGPGQWPAIVDEGLFDVVNAKLSDPRRTLNAHDTARKHLGSGVYFCECGLRVRSGSTRGYEGGSSLRYQCSNICYSRSGHPIDDLVVRVMRERLAQPDLRDLLIRRGERADLTDLDAERRSLRDRIAAVEADYDEGLIDGRRLKAATEKAEARLAEITAIEVRVAGEMSPILAADDPVAAFDTASIAIRQGLLKTFMNVTLLRMPRGPKEFKPESVRIDWLV